MKNATEHAKHLKELLDQLRGQVSPPEPDELEPLHQMVHAFLVWEASRNQAEQAYARLMKETVDLNDLRITDPEEVVDLIGGKYSRADERAHRLHRALHAVYRREHAMDLSSLRSMPKREARAYLHELDGMTPFVAASICLLSLDAHAMPVDEQLHRRLQRDGVIHEKATLDEARAFLERNIRADEAVEAYYCLRAYVERPIKADLGEKAPQKKTTKKKTGRAGA